MRKMILICGLALVIAAPPTFSVAGEGGGDGNQIDLWDKRCKQEKAKALQKEINNNPGVAVSVGILQGFRDSSARNSIKNSKKKEPESPC
jgi:hypothetical protein